MANRKKLFKSSTDRQIMGVCGGFAEYFGVDTTIVRVLFLILLFAWSAGFWIYMLLGILLPYDFQVDSTHTRNTGNGFPNSRQNNRRDVTPEEDPDESDWSDF